MSDERRANNPAALDEATDRVIRAMTQVEPSEDAVSRVMARIRAARGADPAPSRGGWLGALLEPRLSWTAAAATAALAAIVATGATALVLRGEHNPPPAPLVAVASPQPSAAARPSGQPTPTSHPDSLPVKRGESNSAASGAATAGQVASNAAAPAPRVERVRRSGVGKAMAGLDPTVTAATVATPDEEPARGQEAARAVPQDVRLDVTIHDQSGATRPVSKTVSMVVADRESGSIRSQTRMPYKQTIGATGANAPPQVEAWNTEDLPLNVDAAPIILADGHVRVKLGLSYRIASLPPGAAGAPLATANVTKNIIAVLTDGKPLVISESADAATDRKVTVEVKATIQK